MHELKKDHFSSTSELLNMIRIPGLSSQPAAHRHSSAIGTRDCNEH
jgi:hypothetical protein